MASDTIRVKILGVASVVARLRNRTLRMQTSMLRAMNRLGAGLQSHIVREKLSGQVLHRRTGFLSGSIFYQILRGTRRNVIVAKVFVGRQARYGAVHEFGGVFSRGPYARADKRAGHPVLVRPHTARYKRRSFMRSSLEDFRRRGIPQRVLTEAVKEALA